jgi:nucleoside-diphosphate-sugar epimerase
VQNILISGYSGFIGSNLTKKLNNHTLCGVDISQNDSVVRHFNCDSINEFKEIDCIVHLAWKEYCTKSNVSAQEYFDINVGLTQKLFQHFLKSSASKYFF